MNKEHFEKTARQLMDTMERMRFDEYIRYTSDRRRLFWTNFFSGLARGFGSAVGFSLLGGLAILILKRSIEWNILGLGGFLAELTQIVLDKLQ